MDQDLTGRVRTDADLPGVAALLAARAGRIEAIDGRVRMARVPGEIVEDGAAFVAVDRDGTVLGHLRGTPYAVDAESDQRSFAAERGVHWMDLAVTGAAPLRALAAAARAPGAFGGHTDGGPDGALADDALWPSADTATAPLLAEVGLRPAFVLALRPPGPMTADLPPGVRVRPAVPPDDEAVVALHLEEVGFHVGRTPFVRHSPALEPAFRERLRSSGDGRSLDEGGTRYVVAEYRDEVVGMIEYLMWTIADDGTRRSLAPGGYGYLNSVGVRADLRGRGIGRAMVRHVLDALREREPMGYTLWYAVGNPVSSAVWPRLGFVPLWTRYEHRP